MKNQSLTQIKNKEFNFETLELVLHSLNVIANKHKNQGDFLGEEKFFYEKELIMKKLLDPVYIEEVGSRAFVIYDADKHRYRIPIESFSLNETTDFYEELPIVSHSYLHKCGEKITECLDEDALDSFFVMIIEGKYRFLPV